ncbi:flagellar hook-length control protein FliK [Anaerotignum sp.]|uniref:flagellar hook-length control protein FliK n=1 Tax=Anaerotignum sp. TaxID=2039241 RepID=UPI00289917E0|nr:flagellar hook-length control protein FliK [Anaerotignum sp.]
MNTTSVSVNLNISENSKMVVQPKSGKSEDSFKDMIKNVTSRKSPETRSQASDTKKDLKDASNEGTQRQKETNKDKDVTDDKGATKNDKDDGNNVNQLAAYIASSTAILDPIQLAKLVRVPAQEEAPVDTQATAQGDMQKGIQEVNMEGLQTIPDAMGIEGKQTRGIVPLEYAAQPVSENATHDDGTIPLLKQDVTMKAVVDNPHEAVEIKQGAFPKEQNKEGAFSEETGNMENSSIITDLKPLRPEGADDSVVMIKVGDPSLDNSWKQVAEEIGNMVVEKVNNEIQKVSIKLNPKDLGEIAVEFAMKNGKISVSLNCSNESTRALLSSNLDSLSKVVQSSLMQEANVNISYEKAEGQNANRENFDGRGQGQYQGDSNSRNKEQEQSDLDFAQKLRIGIENIETMEV